MLIDIKSRVAKPPFSSVQVDWRHQLAHRLQYVCLAQSQALTDLVGRSPVLVEKSNATVRTSRIGPALVCDATSKGAEVTTPPVLQFSAWPVSLACRLVVLGTPDASAAYAGVSHNNGNTAPFDSYLLFNDSLNRFGLAWNDGTNFQNLSGSRGAVVGETVSVLGVVNGGNVENLYLNGGLDTAGTVTTGTGPAYGATTLLAMANYTGIARLSNVAVDYLYIWNRIVTAAEARQLFAEPYAFLQPVPAVRYWSTPPAAVTPTSGTHVLYLGRAA